MAVGLRPGVLATALKSGMSNERVRIALLVGVALVVYCSTLANSFTFDDNIFIFNNPGVTHFSAKALFEPTKYANLFRPVTFASFALNWKIEGDHPFGYHLVNVLLHAGVTLLLYLVLRRLLEEVRQGTTIAWATALLFAVHPIHTEAVASIAARSELLAAGFLLAAWLWHLGDRPMLALLSLIAAVLSKESAVVFLPLVIAGDYLRARMKAWHRYAGIAGVVAMYMLLLWNVQGGHFGERKVDFIDNPLASLPGSLRILNAARVAWKYAGLEIYPANLSCDYSYNAIPLYGSLEHTVIPAAGALLVVAAWLWALCTKRYEWALAGAIYLGGFGVTANVLIPIGTIMGERLAYLPSAGFCLLVILIWIRLERYRSELAWIVFALVFAALSARTVVRNWDWYDNFSLFSAAVRAAPGSAKAHSNLALQYYNRDDLAAASAELEAALRIYPDNPDTIGYKALLESRGGHDHEAIELLEKALSMTQPGNPNYEFIAVNLAGVQMKLGQDEEALKLLNSEIAKSPDYSRAWSNRAVIRYRRGELPTARSDAETALQLNPENIQARNLLNILNRAQ
jgi:protein O-mannosyl-transferase